MASGAALAVLAFLTVRYLGSDDVAPDSAYGLSFAVVGTALLALAGGGYALRKRLRRHWTGRLHIALTWHVAVGLLALALILLHAAGNYNARTGTYALYGLLAVVTSGIVGRVLDRVAPRLAAHAALGTLSADGAERLDLLERRLGSAPAHPRPPARPAGDVGAPPWDLAYHQLDPATLAVPSLLGRAAPAAAPDLGDAHQRRDPLMLRCAVRREAAALQAALGRETFYVQLVRVWRRLHIALSVVALGLLVWHLIYAASLLLGAR